MRKNTPPNLLIHATDDQVVVPENSILYHKTLQKNKVFSELHILKEDGHGFGISGSNTATQLWLEITKNGYFLARSSKISQIAIYWCFCKYLLQYS